MFYHVLADIVMAAHVAYVSFVVLGLLAILIGLALRWKWVRNPWFRWIHLLMISIVGMEAVMGVQCPLTTWEHELRAASDGVVKEGDFVEELLHPILYRDNEAWPHWLLSCLYLGFAGTIVATFVLAPPRRRPQLPAYLTTNVFLVSLFLIDLKVGLLFAPTILVALAYAATHPGPTQPGVKARIAMPPEALSADAREPAVARSVT
jgi:hypothetical protein